MRTCTHKINTSVHHNLVNTSIAKTTKSSQIFLLPEYKKDIHWNFTFHQNLNYDPGCEGVLMGCLLLGGYSWAEPAAGWAGYTPTRSAACPPLWGLIQTDTDPLPGTAAPVTWCLAPSASQTGGGVGDKGGAGGRQRWCTAVEHSEWASLRPRGLHVKEVDVLKGTPVYTWSCIQIFPSQLQWSFYQWSKVVLSNLFCLTPPQHYQTSSNPHSPHHRFNDLF